VPLDPDVLAANAEIVERLGWSFGFRIETGAREPVWFSVDGIKEFRRIGREGAGGEFALLPPAMRVLYVSSEGQAGILAADFEEFITLIVACPYWHDLLKFSGNGKLNEMRRAAAALEAAYGDDEDLIEARAFLRSQLALPEPADPVGALYRAMSTSDVIVRPPDGEPCTTLFNRFTIDNNPFLRGLVD
jgi:hypothetical protein